MRPKAPKHGRNDKSKLKFGIIQRLRDKAYRKALHFMACVSCDVEDETVVGAHIRTGSAGGMGLKPSDDENLPLCAKCHEDQEANPGPEWWIENVLKPLARKRYIIWKAGS